MGKSIALGDVARDTITKFEGVVVADTKWLHGCRRLTLQPQSLDDKGAPIAAQTFDEPQLVRVETSSFPTTGDGGGPRPEPVRR